MLVLVALITTAVTSPAVSRFLPARSPAAPVPEPAATASAEPRP